MERKLIRVTKTSVVSLLSVTALSQFVVVHADTTSTTDAASAPQESAVVVPSSSDPVVSENNTPAEMTTDSVVTTAVDAPATTYTLVPEETPAMSAPVVLAAETDPPVDEDIPNLEEEQQIKNVNDTLDMIVEFYNSGGVVDAQAVFEDSASDFAAINNIVDMVASKKALLQRIEDVRALIYGTTPTPVVTTRVEAIPMTTTYVADPNATAGVQTVTTAGKDGVKTYTTTNGVEDKGVITTPMTPKVVSVGTKSLVVTEAVVAPADIEQADATLEKGQRVLVSPAKDGSKTSTTTYSLDTSTGKVTANTPTVTTVAGQAAVYRVGTKDPVVTPVVTTRAEAIPMTTTYVADPNATAGVQTVTTAGKDGVKTYTTTNGVEDK
ncbi:G5 domain-containing protein, partial [Streptococcus parauberis]